MTPQMKKVSYGIFGLLSLVYVALSLVIPGQARIYSTRYHLSINQVHLLSLAVILPFVLLWLVGFYGSIKLRSYADLIKDTEDGIAIRIMAKGLFYIALFLPLSSILTLVVNYVSYTHAYLTPTTTIITNYVAVSILLIGFSTLLYGSNLLVATIRKRDYDIKEQFVILLFIITSGLFSYFSLTNPNRQFPTANTGKAVYYLSDLILVLTIVVPYIYILYCGFRTAYNVHLYRSAVGGVFYRQALLWLSYGIGATCLGMIAIRFLGSLSNWINNTTSLQYILIVVYVLLVMVTLGYGLVAAGAKQLRKIEEA